MSVTSVSSPAPGVLANAGTAGADDMQQRFLTLFVTQLKNQDPLNPLDNAQLTSQLAQMSTVSGIQSMQKTLTSMLDASSAAQLLQSAGLIGHTVLFKGSDLDLAEGQAAAFQFGLPSSAESVKAVITDRTGTTIRTLDLGPQAPGTRAASWDGRNDAGQQVADGSYTLKVVAANGGKAVPADTFVYGIADNVAHGATGQGVDIQLTSGRSVSLADVQALR